MNKADMDARSSPDFCTFLMLESCALRLYDEKTFAVLNSLAKVQPRHTLVHCFSTVTTHTMHQMNAPPRTVTQKASTLLVAMLLRRRMFMPLLESIQHFPHVALEESFHEMRDAMQSPVATLPSVLAPAEGEPADNMLYTHAIFAALSGELTALDERGIFARHLETAKPTLLKRSQKLLMTVMEVAYMFSTEEGVALAFKGPWDWDFLKVYLAGLYDSSFNLYRLGMLPQVEDDIPA